MSRKAFAQLLHEEMKNNDRIWLLTGDLGFGVLDSIRRDFPERTFNMGAAEFLMTGAAIGLAESGKIAVTYSITPFTIFRPFELLRTYVNYESIPIKMVGCGRDKDYLYLGKSHWGDDDEAILSTLPNINSYRPESDEQLAALLPEFLGSRQPAYINLRR